MKTTVQKFLRTLLTGKNPSIFIVAEISANHGQNFNRAVSLIKKAKECGADAVKFQIYTPDTLTIDVNNKHFRIKHPKWGGQTLYQLYKKAYTPWKWFKKLKKIADDLGIIFFSTAFDKTAVNLLEELDVPIHKIASFELVDLPLIATPEEMNLKTIPHMKKLFNCPVGLSDHTVGIGVSIAAVSLGARVIEKHFTLSRTIKTPDSFFSIEPQELRELVENVRIAEKALGKVHYGLTPEQKKSRVFRRSLFAVNDIEKGETFTKDNIRSIRPANGLKPKYLKIVLGKRAKKDIKRGMPLERNVIG